MPGARLDSSEPEQPAREETGMSYSDKLERFRSEIIQACFKRAGVKLGETPTDLQREEAITLAVRQLMDNPSLRKLFFESDES